MLQELELIPQNTWLTPLRADTIFGHLCWRLVRKYGRKEVGGNAVCEELETFLTAMQDPTHGPLFVLSDALPYGMVPRPTTRHEHEIDAQEDRRVAYDSIRDIRERAYIRIQGLGAYRQGYYPGVRSAIKQSTREASDFFGSDVLWKNVVRRDTGTTGDDSLYAHVAHGTNIHEATKEQIPLRILFRDFPEHPAHTLLETYNIRELLREVLAEGYGKRKSVGYGQFRVGEWQGIDEPGNANGTHLLVLSSFVPSPRDPVEGLYRSDVKYGKLGEERAVEGNHHKKPLVMIRPGATFTKPDDYKGYVGRMVTGLSEQYTDVVDYAYGFTVEF